MKTSKLTTFQIALLSAVVVLIATFVVFRYAPGNFKPMARPYSTEEETRKILAQQADDLVASPSNASPSLTAGQDMLPQPTSAAFTGGDVLRGLGPNWTFVSQQDQRVLSMSYIAGTAPERESVVRLLANPQIGLVIEESRIADRGMLDAALKGADVKPKTVAGKSGYLVPMGGLAGGQAFLLAGSSTVLILQDADAANWPATPNSEVEMYIRTVDVP